MPDLDTFFALDAPQPFVQLYALALGKGPSIFMTIIAVLGLILVNSFSPPCNSVIDTVLAEYQRGNRRRLPSNLRSGP